MLWKVILSGAIAALVMTGVLTIIGGSRNYNPVYVLGSSRGGDVKHAGLKGEIIHLALGIAFAFIYYGLLALFDAPLTDMTMVATCTAIGFSHGLFASFILGVTVVRWHPQRAVQRSLGGVVLLYMAGHIIFGLTVGLSFALLGVQPSSAFLQSL